MEISIIICTYNSSKLLSRCLSSLVNVDLNNIDYEIIIVDNNSNDDTKNIVEDYILINNNIKYNFFSIQGLAKARNYGISLASKKYILFTDDDITFDKDFIKGYVNLIKLKNPGMAGGRILLKYNRKRPNWLSDKIDYMYGWIDYGVKTIIFPTGSYPLGPSFLIKSSLLKEIGDFNPNLGLSGQKETILRGEETDLAIRFKNYGIPLYYCGGSLVYHNVNEKRLNKEWFISRFENSGKIYGKLNVGSYIKFYIKYILSKFFLFLTKDGSKNHFYFLCKNHFFKNILKI